MSALTLGRAPAEGRDASAMKYRLVIFDMDGTLSDSFPWFARVLNTVAERFHFRKVAPDDVEMLRGLGSREILDWLGVPLWKVPLIARHMRALKTQHLDDIPLFPGVDRILAELAARGAVIAIVSSDGEDNVRRALGAANARHIAHLACGSSMFGKQAKFRSVLRRSGITEEQAIAIGDETRDAEAARAAGIAFGAVAWGYSHIDALRPHAPNYVFCGFDDIITQLA